MSQKPESVIRHLTQGQLADRWQMSPRTLERWRWLGEGPRFLKLGGRVIYRLEDVEVYEAQQLRDSTTAALTATEAAIRTRTGTRQTYLRKPCDPLDVAERCLLRELS
jgi:hypothetical protein